MYLTKGLLKERRACVKGMSFFEKKYPEGVEAKELILDSSVPDNFIFWGIENIPHSSEEAEAFNQRFKLINSTSCIKSKEVSNSNIVVRSSHIQGSSFVQFSDGIKNSQTVVKSSCVKDSSQIFDSSFIYQSNKIRSSTNVNASTNIVESVAVNESSDVFQSQRVTKSRWVLYSNNCNNSSFISDSEDLTFSMFCSGIKSEKYCIFNHPVSEEEYFFYADQLKTFFDFSLFLVEEWPSENLRYHLPKIVGRRDLFFKELPDNFLQWVSTIPNYDPFLLYQIIMRKDFLQ